MLLRYLFLICIVKGDRKVKFAFDNSKLPDGLEGASIGHSSADHLSFRPHHQLDSTHNLVMATNLIPLLLTLYIIIAIISAIGKDFLVELVSKHSYHSNARRGEYTPFFPYPFVMKLRGKKLYRKNF